MGRAASPRKTAFWRSARSRAVRTTRSSLTRRSRSCRSSLPASICPADAAADRSGEGRTARGCDASDAASRRRPLPVGRATRLRASDLPARSLADGPSPVSAPAAHRGRCRHRQDHRGRPDPARADGSRRGRCVLRALPAASRRTMGGRAEGPLRDRGRRGHVRHGQHGWNAACRSLRPCSMPIPSRSSASTTSRPRSVAKASHALARIS